MSEVNLGFSVSVPSEPLNSCYILRQLTSLSGVLADCVSKVFREPNKKRASASVTLVLSKLKVSEKLNITSGVRRSSDERSEEEFGEIRVGCG